MSLIERSRRADVYPSNFLRGLSPIAAECIFILPNLEDDKITEMVIKSFREKTIGNSGSFLWHSYSRSWIPLTLDFVERQIRDEYLKPIFDNTRSLNPAVGLKQPDRKYKTNTLEGINLAFYRPIIPAKKSKFEWLMDISALTIDHPGSGTATYDAAERIERQWTLPTADLHYIRDKHHFLLLKTRF